MVVGSFGRSLQRRATVVGTTSKEETVLDSSMRYEALTRKRNAGMEWNEIGYARRFVRKGIFFISWKCAL